MIEFKLSGDFKKVNKFFEIGSKIRPRFKPILERYAILGLEALQKATPIDSGLSASMWHYQVTVNGILYFNDNLVDGVPVVILLNYGHAARNGRYIPGNNFINKAIQPIFDDLSEQLWKEVQAL